jgi:hypothetical protein
MYHLIWVYVKKHYSQLVSRVKWRKASGINVMDSLGEFTRSFQIRLAINMVFHVPLFTSDLQLHESKKGA